MLRVPDNLKRLLFILIVMIFVQSIAQAQKMKITRDLESWTSLSLSKDLNSLYNISLEQELRLNRNALKFKNTNTELFLSRKLNKGIWAGVTLRYKHLKNAYEESVNRYRYGIFTKVRLLKNKYFRLHAFVKYQKEFNNTIKDYTDFWKFKIKSTFKLKKSYSLVVSSEIFREREICKSPVFETSRSFVGVKRKLKNGNILLALGYDRELKSRFPASIWFIKLKYNLEL